MQWDRRHLNHRHRRVLARAGVRPSVRPSVRPTTRPSNLRPLSRLRCLEEERRACDDSLDFACPDFAPAPARPPRNLFRESPERQARLYLPPSPPPPSLCLPSILPTSRHRVRGPLFFHSHSLRCQAPDSRQGTSPVITKSRRISHLKKITIFSENIAKYCNVLSDGCG